jgi:hypothetical protein
LGIQCETLSIKVKKASNILDLVNNMPNLRALNVLCEGDDWRSRNCFESEENDEFVNWLYEYFPSACTITRDEDKGEIIRIWIL